MLNEKNAPTKILVSKIDGGSIHADVIGRGRDMISNPNHILSERGMTGQKASCFELFVAFTERKRQNENYAHEHK